MLEIFDNYCWEDNKKVIPYQVHRIDGLGNFAYWNFSSAVPPTPVHFHSNIVEFHCLIKGKRYCNVNNRTFSLKGNEMFTTFPFEPHGSTRLLQNPSSFYGFQVNLKKPTGLLGLNKEYSRALYSILTSMKKRHLRFTSTETQLLKTSFDCIGSDEPEKIHLGVQYLSCFLFMIPDFEEVSEEEPESDNSFFSRVLDHIDRHFQDELHLQDLADISGYSLSRFKMKFKEEIGITPANFITFRKLEHAKKLLTNTDHSITRIALDSGFSSSNYFCTVMKRVSNYTPSEFRKMIRGTDLSFGS